MKWPRVEGGKAYRVFKMHGNDTQPRDIYSYSILGKHSDSLAACLRLRGKVRLTSKREKEKTTRGQAKPTVRGMLIPPFSMP